MSSGPAAAQPGSVTLTVPFAPTSAGLVRRALQSWMREQGCSSEHIEDARLVATELVGNAVRHARPIDPGHVLVRWHRDRGALVLSISDGGGTSVPQERSVGTRAEGGRGLNIVSALVQRWWVDRELHRNTVHALVPLGALVAAGGR
jgi:anti-sigma regulatory factor (Ser/Thr protein kinase)